MMPTCKCKGCGDRKVGCHSTCEDYKKFKEETIAFNKKKQKEMAIGRDIRLGIAAQYRYNKRHSHGAK